MKRRRPPAPVVCLQIADAVKKEKYQVDTLVLSISLPAQMCVREVSVRRSVSTDGGG